jgi:hypothetical protein
MSHRIFWEEIHPVVGGQTPI